jgi:hypothetical protein
VDDLGERCGGRAVFGAYDFAVADTTDGPVAVVALGDAGVAVRSVAGVWSRVPVSQGPVPPPATTITTPARATRTAPLVPLDPVKKWSRPRQHSWTVVPPDYD